MALNLNTFQCNYLTPLHLIGLRSLCLSC